MRTATPARRLPSLFSTLGCLGLIAVAGLAGCTKSQTVPVAGFEAVASQPWPAMAPRVDISNFNGRVDLVVDEKLTAPCATATAWSCGEKVDAKEPGTQAQMDVTAALADGVYRVVTAGQETLPAGVGVNLTVRVPSASAITIYNRGGPVKILGATSGVQVENGRGSGGNDTCWMDDDHEPWIQLRTGAAIDQPIALITDDGDVALVLGPGSKGAFDLQAPNGSVRANARVGTFDKQHSKQHTLSARYNGGTNAVMLRSERGDVRALLIEKPEDYAMIMW